MDFILNKSASESNIEGDRTPPNYIAQRNKRAREPDYEMDFDAFKNEMREMISTLMSEQNSEIKKMYPTLMEIKNTNMSIEKSVAFLSEQNEEMRKKIEQLELQARKDKSYIVTLEDKIEDMQRSSRKANLEIKNAPKNPKETKEDLINMVLSLSKAIDYKIEKNDIMDVYRVQSKKEKTMNSPIIVEMTSTIQKTEFLRLSKTFNIKHKDKLCARHLGFTNNEYTPIYVSEQLTAKGARLYFLARDLKNSKNYRFCWTAYGRVYVRKNENSPIISIKSENQIQSLMTMD